MTSRLLRLLVPIAICCANIHLTRGAELRIQNLGSLPELGVSQFCYASAINDRGEVAGHCSDIIDGRFKNIAFKWNSKTGMQSLGTDGDDHSFARAINNAGEIVGYTYSDSGEWQSARAFRYYQGSMERLNTPLASYSIGNSINDTGLIIGAHDSDVLYYDDGSLVDVGRLGAVPIVGNSVNQHGDVVGDGVLYYGTDGYPVVRAFMFADGELAELGALDGKNSSAFAINDLRQAVGYAERPGVTTDGDPVTHAVLFQDGEVIDLYPFGSSYSIAKGINNSGWIIGSYRDGANHRSFVSINGRIRDIYEVAPVGGDWTLNELTDINERGQIVGSGSAPTGGYRAFLLTPVAEPQSSALFAATAVGCVVLVRARRECRCPG